MYAITIYSLSQRKNKINFFKKGVAISILWVYTYNNNRERKPTTVKVEKRDFIVGGGKHDI